MAKLADALASGASGRKVVGVQLPLSASLPNGELKGAPGLGTQLTLRSEGRVAEPERAKRTQAANSPSPQIRPRGELNFNSP